jgi:hypothetical protein
MVRYKSISSSGAKPTDRTSQTKVISFTNNSSEENYSSEADSNSSGGEIPRLLRNAKVHYLIQNTVAIIKNIAFIRTGHFYPRQASLEPYSVRTVRTDQTG